MGHEVRITRDASPYPLGSLVMNAFSDITDWLVEQGYLVSSLTTDQTLNRVHLICVLDDPRQAVMLKLRWAGS